ncbi:MAG: hypothetical protein K2W94_01800 [Alphaproteobacteria bacterium]|nr:hypothetical protein [Alphaproteobacteria bacterium]
MTNLILDGLIMSFFIMAIIFCWHLNKRIHEIKKLGARTTPFANSFSRSIAQVTKELNKLKEASEKGQDAEIVRKDFEELIHQSESIMIRLDQLIEKAQKAEHILRESAAIKPKTDAFAKDAYKDTYQEDPAKRAPFLSLTPTEQSEPRLFQKAPDLSMDRNLMTVLRGIR